MENDISSSKPIEQEKLTVICKSLIDLQEQSDSNGGSDETVKRVFNVKSMRVDWNRELCFMHVFFVNNDSAKLEKANNNIKLQKVMFASISHEFRTPLNAIINSYHLLSDVFRDLMVTVKALARQSSSHQQR